jgi:hypothetical protein
MRVVKWGVLTLVGLFAVIQLVPYGRDHTNPPVTQEASWPTRQARQLAVDACYDCHSNQTNWRWYSFVAPASWYVANHVNEGRDALNFSEWDRPQRAGELSEAVLEGSMPPRYYTLIHPASRLSRAEKQALADALGGLSPAGGQP